MSHTLTRLRARLRQALGNLSTTQMPDVEADELLNDSLWELEAKYPFKEKECLRLLTLTAGTHEYTLPSDVDALISISIVDDEDGRYQRLKRISFDEYESNAADDDTNRRSKPVYWLRRDNILSIYPYPDKAYVLRMTFWKDISSLVAGTVEAVNLPRNWSEIVLLGAIYRGHINREDLNLAQQVFNFKKNLEDSAVDVSAKEEKSRYAGVKPIASFPDAERELV